MSDISDMEKKIKQEFQVSPVPSSVKPITYDEKLCIGCNRCMEACMIDVMTPGEKGQHPVVSYPDECWYCGCCPML